MTAVRTSFGLDLSGYSTGKTAVAMARDQHGKGAVAVSLLTGHAFARKVPGTAEIAAQIRDERWLLGAMLDRGRVFVDVPIDLQALPSPGDAVWIWQLTRRPVDRAFRGLPPLADRLGAPTARLLHIFRDWPERSLQGELGVRLFETYPAACLDLLGLSDHSYKGTTAQSRDGQWVGDAGMVAVAEGLGLKGEPGVVLDDDGVDAIVCALCGMASEGCVLQGAALEDEMVRRLGSREWRRLLATRHAAVPRGYTLLRGRPREASVGRMACSEALGVDDSSCRQPPRGQPAKPGVR